MTTLSGSSPRTCPRCHGTPGVHGKSCCVAAELEGDDPCPGCAAGLKLEAIRMGCDCDDCAHARHHLHHVDGRGVYVEREAGHAPGVYGGGRGSLAERIASRPSDAPPVDDGGPRRVYIAAAREDWALARILRRALIDAGHTVVSTWHDGDELPKHDGHYMEIEALAVAMRCLGEMCAADTVAVLDPPDDAGKGVYAEAGYAIAMVHVGEIERAYLVMLARQPQRRSALLAPLDRVHGADGLIEALGGARRVQP